MVNPQHSKTPKKPIPQSSHHAQPHNPTPVTSAVNLRPTTPEGVLQLQRLIGNQATQHLLAQQESAVIQRFPGKKRLLETVGKKPFKKLLKPAENYYQYAKHTSIGTSAGKIKEQFIEIARLLDVIERVLQEYIQLPETKDRASNFLEQLKRDRMMASRTLVLYLSNPPGPGDWGRKGPNILWAMEKYGDEYHRTPIDPDTEGQSEKGAMSSVTEYRVGGRSGFFKEEKNTLYNPAPGGDLLAMDGRMRADKQREIDNVGTEEEKDAIGEKYIGLQSEYSLGITMVGIDPDNARMTNRDVAMSLLDSLLGADVIARAQFAILNIPDAKKTGGFMEKARGTKASELKTAGRFIPRREKKGEKEKGEKEKGEDAPQISIRDPKLLQLLSRLQWIDLIALQVDRGLQNYFIEYDNKGNVVGVTGIDNDLALGKTVGNEGELFERGLKVHELPGVSRFVDKEMAERILKLDPPLLRLLLMSLLNDDELNALIERVELLQSNLKSGYINFLGPKDWKKHVDAIINEQEGANYAASLKGKLGMWED